MRESNRANFGPIPKKTPTPKVKLRHSASSLETARTCIRKYVFAHVLYWRSQSSKAIKGDLCHKELDKYLRTGELDPKFIFKSSIDAMLPFIPQPGTPGLTSEEKHKFQIDRFDFSMVTDWAIPLERSREVIIGDHKFTSSVKFAKDTREKTLHDIQAAAYVYRYWSLGFDTFHTRWNYVEHPRQNVDGTWTKAKVISNWQTFKVEDFVDTIEGMVEDMEHVQKIIDALPHPMDCEPSLSGCDAFGGCPYEDYCTDITPKMRAAFHTARIRQELRDMSDEELRAIGTKKPRGPRLRRPSGPPGNPSLPPSHPRFLKVLR